MDKHQTRTGYILIFSMIFSMIVVTYLSGLYAHLDNLGRFEPWISLGKPPEKAIKIYYDKDYLPFVETANGQIYHRTNLSSNSQESSWVEIDRSELELGISSACYPIEPLDVPRPPGKVIDMVEFEGCEMGLAVMSVTNIQHNFALLEDGSVWGWKHRRSSFSAGMHVINYVLLGICLGGIIGPIITMILYFLIRKKTD